MMHLTSFTLLLVFTTAVADEMAWEQYVADYDKPWEPGTPDWEAHKLVFEATLARIREHNEALSAPEKSFAAAVRPTHKLGLNWLSDLPPQERSRFKGFDRSSLGRAVTLSDAPAPPSGTPPASVDWREKGVVGPVHRQRCGDCWAFSTVETMESHAAIASGKLLELSEQQIVACVENPKHCGGTGGCSGATMELGFAYIQKHGLALNASFPYVGRDSSCPASSAPPMKPGVRSTGYVSVTPNNYTALLHAVAFVGPVSVVVDASWGDYASGVFTPSAKMLTNPTLDHGVQVVGYGTEGSGPDAVPYWLVWQNST